MATLRLPLTDLPAYLAAIASRVQAPDLTVPLKTASLLLTSATKQNFAGGTDPDGNVWAPLKHPRSRRRDKVARRVGSDLVLRDTGVLMASATAGPGSIVEVGPKSLRFGTSIFYGAFHQLGTRRMPQRRFLGLTPQLRQRINAAIARYVARLAGGGTFPSP